MAFLGRTQSFLLTAVALALLASPTFAAEVPERVAPFGIPPNGSPEVLVGGIDLEAPCALAFDSRNRPYMFDTREPEHFGYILSLRDGKWVRLSCVDALRKAYPDMVAPQKRFNHALGSLAIDAEDGLYAIIRINKGPGRSGFLLLYSDDLGDHFHVYDLPGIAFLETWTGHNDLDSPPAIGCLRWRKNHPAQWTAYHDLEVFLTTRNQNGLSLGAPVHISSDCFGVSNHSGGYSFAVTRGRQTHLAYVDIPVNGKGNPTHVATIDRGERRVTARQFLVNAPPRKPDVHSTPVIAADSTGILHVLAGAHFKESFYYTHSLKPNTVAEGWSEPVAQNRDQTYATLLCDSSDRLHTVYRKHPQLLYVHKPAGADKWSPPRELVRAPTGHKGYTVFYHRLFIDRKDALYLSFTFYEFHTGDKGRYPRALAISEDGGKSWHLATTATIQSRVIGADHRE
jgi:hypothetical protein